MVKTWEDYGISVPIGAPEEYQTTCPQCSHTRKKKKAKCLGINTVKNVWICHHCAWRGGLTSGVEDKGSPRRNLKPWVPPTPALVPLTEEQTDWFADRGISPSTLKHYGVFGGYAYYGELEDEALSIRFPYRWQDTLWSIKSRTMDKKFTRTPSARKILFGMDKIAEYEKTLIFAEGEGDILALYECGIKNAVSVPDGAPPENSKEVKMEYLEECQEFISRFTHFVIAVDSDAPGKRLEQELSRRLGIDSCKKVIWPLDCKDANDVLVKYGEEALRECIDQAQEYPVNGIFGVKELSEDMYRDFKEGEEPGLYVGFENMRSAWSMRAGEFTIVSGIPSSGKSSIVTQMAVNMALNHKWKWAIFPAESLPLYRYANSIIELYTGKSVRKGAPNKMTDREYTDGMQFVNDHFKFIMPTDDEWTVKGILDKCRTAVLRYGSRGIIIDPFTELSDATSQSGGNSSEHIGRQLTRIRTFARNNSVHLILVAHPKSLLPNPKTGLFDRPSAYSISGSANFYNKADNILIVHRDDKTKNVAEVYMEKVRFKIVGMAGVSCMFDYNRMNGRFTPAAIE